MICAMADQLILLRRRPSCRLVAIIVLDFDRRRRRLINCYGYSEYCDLSEGVQILLKHILVSDEGDHHGTDR
jgi:hypothetical protein